MKKWYLSKVTKLLEKSALIEYWTEMHIQGDKYSLLKCGGCNLNTKGKENRCIINYNKNFIKGAAVGITKRENNWITNFSTKLLKDKPEYHLTLVQKCPLLQIKEIDRAERELVKSQNFTKKKNLKEIKGSKCRSEDTSNSLITKIKELFQELPTKAEALKHICLKLEAQAINLAWAYFKDKTRAVITLRDLCKTVLYKTRQEWCRA
ncbi:39606_t:CDS:2 [Gigaspora margarita]|uniref:39606_t:CDS:1 n=1 Tax=Gigaspora margarita TaxID=4874 RepID=A0ABN7UG91_GIGMA|nr:39606_t:CDS:2 [Gigaspora margarita]